MLPDTYYKNEARFFNNHIAKLDYHQWEIPAQNDKDYFNSHVFRTYAQNVKDLGTDLVSPDLLIFRDNKVVSSLEVFQVEGTKSENESLNDAKFGNFVKDFNKKKDLNKESGVSSRKDFEYDFCLDSYIGKFKRNFNKHYIRINNYKTNLLSLGQECEIGFLITDNFYNAVIFSEKIPFNPLCVDEIIEFILDKNKVKFFIFFVSNATNPQVIFIRNNYDSLKCAKEKYARVNLNTEFRNPKTTSVFAAIKVNFKIDASVTDGVVHIDDFKETDAKKEE